MAEERSVSDPAEADADHRTPRTLRGGPWLAFAAALTVIGLVASIVGYHAVADGDAQQSRQ